MCCRGRREVPDAAAQLVVAEPRVDKKKTYIYNICVYIYIYIYVYTRIHMRVNIAILSL